MTEVVDNVGSVVNSKERVEQFFKRERRLILDYAAGLPVVFEQGDGWAVDPETGKATYDPNFFVEQGYSETQAVFATLHEVDHVAEFAEMLKTQAGRKLYEGRKKAKEDKRRLHVLDNCLLDVADNKRVLNRAPSLEEETKRLYQEKLWPETNLTVKPRHLQLAYAILREGMLPDQVQIDPEVREAIEELSSIEGKSGKTHNIIEIVTDPNTEPVSKFKLIEKFIDPVYERLFEEDVKNKDKENSDEEGGSDEQSGESESSEDAFSKEYDEFDRKMPQAMNDREVESAATGAGQGRDIADRQKAGYEKEHGVDIEDVMDYREEYNKIEKYIEPLREQFRKIVEERLIPKRRLVGMRDEGVIIDPGLVAQAQAEFDRGVVDPVVFRDFEGKVVREEVPAAFELTGVFDRSGSMESGGKKEEQRRAALLLMEAIQEFMEQPEVRDQRIDPDMYASSEIRSFGGQDENVLIKPLSSGLDEKQRVNVFKILNSCPGWATEDYVVLGQIIDEMNNRGAQEPDYLKKVKESKVVKIVAIFSDGASSNQSEYDRKKAELEEMGVKVVDYRKIRDGVNFIPQMADLLEDALKDLRYTDNRKTNE